MTYAEAVASLESRGIMPERPPSLEPMREGLRRLDFASWGMDPDRVVVVAGTNGKGSVCASLEALLLSAGERVGLYISPHLVETTERFRIGGTDVRRDLFCQALKRVEERIEDLPLTHFEMLTLMAAWIFCSGEAIRPMDRVILEVGLGGVWDATNAIPHATAVITALGMDHVNILGGTLEEIAKNKFGIIGPGARVVHAPLPPEVREVALSTRQRTRSQWVESADFPWIAETPGGRDFSEPRFQIRTPWGFCPIALPGGRGARNAALALTVFKELGFEPAAHLGALAQVRWPGRMERWAIPEAPCPVFASGDHNPQGVASLLELLPYYRRKRLHVLVGVGRDKDLEGVLKPLYSLNDASIYLTETPFRGRALDDYGTWGARAAGAWADPRAALGEVLSRAEPGDLVLVTGSLYLVGLLTPARS